MSDLDEVNGLIAKGDKEKAIPLLASILLKNKDNVEAWFLLGELIDDPSRKKDCYKQVLRLVPDHSQASTRLQKLEYLPAGEIQTTGSENTRTDTKRPLKKLPQYSGYVRNQNLYSPIHNSSENREVIAYVIGGIVAFLIILYVIANRDDASNDNTILYVGLIFLILIAALIVGSVGNKHRG
jgi:hypothetical protein